MKFEHAQNTLKYKVGDVVVLAENVDQNDEQTFIPGALVEIKVIPDDEHYTVALKNDPSDIWWVTDDEINHEATALLQTSNKSGYLVQKISVENDVVSSAVNTSDNGSKSQDNSWFKRSELPPVGTVCETKLASEFQYVLVRIEWYSPHSVVVSLHTNGEERLYSLKHRVFRPYLTAEQIAAEEREKAIHDMESLVNGYGLWGICAKLYDAGYRLVGEGVQHGN